MPLDPTFWMDEPKPPKSPGQIWLEEVQARALAKSMAIERGKELLLELASKPRTPEQKAQFQAARKRADRAHKQRQFKEQRGFDALPYEYEDDY